uniref:Uncharacterized protein n=1 Tax=Loa loa TaxID=7209 RepID=A0A1I7W3X4_LOALO
MNDDLDIDKMGRYWSETKKKRRPFRQKDSGTENNNEDSIGLGEQAMNLSSPRGESPSQPSSPAHIDTKTALRAPSMVISYCESLRAKKKRIGSSRTDSSIEAFLSLSN